MNGKNELLASALLAKWQPKGAKDRTKSAGAWVCPKCGQRLATVVFDYQPKTRMCGGSWEAGVALVLPTGIDPRGKTGVGFTFKGPFYFGPEIHFEKTKRHAARQAHGRSEIGEFEAHLAESRNERQEQYAKENLLEIRKEREPIAPVFLDFDQLPATFGCSRPGCGVVARIEIMAPREVLDSLQKKLDKASTVSENALFGTRAQHKNRGKGFPIVTKKEFFG